jgi:hypothetical protein
MQTSRPALASILLAAFSLALCAEAAAQGMFKCKDAAGKITYAGQECDKLGLTDAGEVKGRTSIAPAYKPPPDAGRAAPGRAAQGAPVAAEAPKKAEERRCFTVKTAKGTATRCNDDPEKAEQGSADTRGKD